MIQETHSQQNYAKSLMSSRTIKSVGLIKTIRIFIAEFFLGLAMDIAPAGTEEKTEIAEFCVSYFSKRVNSGDY
jgi:hypothetical protein